MSQCQRLVHPICEQPIIIVVLAHQMKMILVIVVRRENQEPVMLEGQEAIPL